MTSRKEHWSSVYSSKENNVSWYQRKPELSLKLFEELKLHPEAEIIDVGGGTSTFTKNLFERGYSNLTVLDIALPSLNKAKIKFGENNNIVNWIEQNILEFKSDKKFNLWHDRAVFHFFTKTIEQLKYKEIVSRCLVPGGYFILSTFAIDGPKRCSGLDAAQYDEVKIVDLFGDNFTLIKVCSEVHQTPFNTEQKFNYFIMKKL